MTIFTRVSAVFAVLLMVAPLGPVTASAQTSGVAPVEPMKSMQPETIEGTTVQPPGTGAKVGAGVLNVVYVPGKALTCGAGTIVAGLMALATFGTAYREAVSFFNEGCGGAWLLTPEQVAAAPKKAQFEY
jgi:hypothetical protein